MNDMFDVYEGWTLETVNNGTMPLNAEAFRGRLSSMKERRISNKSMLSSVFNVYSGPAA